MPDRIGTPRYPAPQRDSRVSILWLLAVILCLALNSCSRGVTTEPGVVTFLIESMPTNLDPRIGTDAQSERLDSLIFSSLVQLDESRIVQGDLAEKWEMPDAQTYVFHLRSGVKFHDGRNLSAADVKYTFDSILNGTVSSPKHGSFVLIQSIDTPDPYTVIFHLKEAYAGFLWNIARPAIGIVPAGAGIEFARQLIGTGPFRFVSAEQDNDVIIERNPGYFGKPAKISRVRFRVVPEAIVRALELRKGTADLEVNSLSPDMIPILRAQSTLEVTEQPGTNYAYVAFNFENPVLNKREVRQALAVGTDRDQIVRYLLRGQARLSDGPLPANSWAYDSHVSHYSYDPQQAERLLDAAGLQRSAVDGMRAKLVLKTSTEEFARLLGAVLREQWRKIGVDLELRPLEFATLYSDITRGNFDLCTLRWIGANNDPDIFDYVFSSKRMPPAGANRGHYRNTKLDGLLDQARVESDLGKRREFFAQVQKIVGDELPYLSLWFMDNISVHRKRIKNIRLSPSGDYDFLQVIEAE